MMTAILAVSSYTRNKSVKFVILQKCRITELSRTGGVGFNA